jgi:hypothetical protein
VVEAVPGAFWHQLHLHLLWHRARSLGVNIGANDTECGSAELAQGMFATVFGSWAPGWSLVEARGTWVILVSNVLVCGLSCLGKLDRCAIRGLSLLLGLF